MEWPNWMVLLWANHIWCVLSKSIITFHQKPSHKKVIFQVDHLKIGGKKGQISKYKEFSHGTNSNSFQMHFMICSKWKTTVPLVQGA
jgi:hypothetical protein